LHDDLTAAVPVQLQATLFAQPSSPEAESAVRSGHAHGSPSSCSKVMGQFCCANFATTKQRVLARPVQMYGRALALLQVRRHSPSPPSTH
jgi:hypothetical protein